MRLLLGLLCLGVALGDALPEIPADIGAQTSAELAVLGICLTGLVLFMGSSGGQTQIWIRKGKIPFDVFRAWWASKGITVAYLDPAEPDNNYVLNGDQSRIEAILNQ